jgi:putative endonuclease
MQLTHNNTWYVYIISTSKLSLYTGITNCLEKRLHKHRSKQGAKFFYSCQAIDFVFIETHPNRSEASKRECFIKKLTKKQKLKLIESYQKSSHDT